MRKLILAVAMLLFVNVGYVNAQELTCIPQKNFDCSVPDENGRWQCIPLSGGRSWTSQYDDMVNPVPDPTPDPIPDPTPTPHYPIVLALGSHTYINGWTITGDWASTPEGNVNLGTNTLNAPVVTYALEVLEDATYYVWIRGEGDSASSDSVNYGIDGNRKASITFLNRPWSNFTQYTVTKATIDLVAESYDFSVWMREDGTRIGDIHITTDINYIPE